MDSEVYVKLEELEDIIKESGFTWLAHGTGRSNDDVIASIFDIGLRTKDNSLYYTTIGLSAPTPELIASYKDLNLPLPTMDKLKEKLNNWPHLNSKNIIIIRVPTMFINMIGDQADLDGEMYGAFFTEQLQENGKATFYLDPKFIVGCYNSETGLVRLNKKFETKLSSKSNEELKEKYQKTLEKTNLRLKRLAEEVGFIL